MALTVTTGFVVDDAPVLERHQPHHIESMDRFQATLLNAQ
jgi:multidrug efflux pump subunit AcrB